ncbi:MAG: aldo/keto reductase family protein [Caldilineaceae bacterium]
MQYRRVGRAGMKVSAISLGAWITYGGSVEDQTATQCIRTAIENGINFIDVADAYAKGQAEIVVGKAIKEFKRSDLVLSSKLFWPQSDNINDRGLSRKHIMESIHKTLKRFDTDYIDLYFCHRFDAETPMEETVRAMDDLVHQGKILYWGTSVWSAAQIQEAVDTARQYNCYLPQVEQPRYNMFDRHVESENILDTCAKNGIGVVCWSPLAQGLLTGKYNNGVPEGSRASQQKGLQNELTDAKLGQIKALAKLASDQGLTVGQLALAWILRRPELSSAIIGASKPEQVIENVKAADVTLGEEVVAKIEEILK